MKSAKIERWIKTPGGRWVRVYAQHFALRERLAWLVVGALLCLAIALGWLVGLLCGLPGADVGLVVSAAAGGVCAVWARVVIRQIAAMEDIIP